MTTDNLNTEQISHQTATIDSTNLIRAYQE